jgi:surfeit locus 1 family protein
MDEVIPQSKDVIRLPGKALQGGSVKLKIVCLLLSATLLPLLLGLGLWQLQRAEAKRILIQQAKEAPVTYRLTPQPQQLPGRVELRVTLLSNQLLLLDNRTRAGSVGYELLSLFQDTGSGRWGIVNLGWIPAGVDRTLLPRLPPLPDLEQQISLKGMQVSAQPGFMLGADTWQPGWPKIIQQPDMARFEQLFQRPLYPAIVRLTEPAVALTDTRWDLVVMPPEKHLGYAVQWFALALALASWLLWFGWWRSHSPGAESQEVV